MWWPWYDRFDCGLPNHCTREKLIQVKLCSSQLGTQSSIIQERNYFKWSYDLHSYERNFSNCQEKREKFWTSTRFQPYIWPTPAICPVGWASRRHREITGSNPTAVAQFFRILYTIAKIAFISLSTIPSFDFISQIQDMIHFVQKLIRLESRAIWSFSPAV